MRSESRFNICRSLPSLLAALVLLIAAPASAMYKCVLNGKTTFQEQACVDGAKETIIKSTQKDTEPDAAPTSAPTVATDQEKLDVLESDRLRRETAYALRDKTVEFTNQQVLCERTFGVVYSRSGDAARTISGATYPQFPNDPTNNAAAARCIARTSELQQQLGVLRAQCATRKCE